MRGLWPCVLLALMLTIMGAGAAQAASLVRQTLVLAKGPGVVKVWQSDSGLVPHASVRLNMPYGYSTANLNGAVLEQSGPDWLQVRPDNSTVIVTYTLNSAPPFVFQEQVVRPLTLSTVLAGPGVFPSGLASQPYRVVGSVTLAGKPFTEFVATDVTPGTQILWPMQLTPSGAAAGPLMLLLSGAVIAVAAWLGVRRHRHLRQAV